MSFLTDIVASTRARLADWPRFDAPPIEHRASLAQALRSVSAMRSARPGVIAEIKRKSPSSGDLAPKLDAVSQATRYAEGGAVAISVLTEPTWFGGSLDDLRAVCAAVDRPVLMKDFVLDERQVDTAALLGASAVLLIVRLLDDERLQVLQRHARTCGLEALVECHDSDEIDRAVRSGASILGINNRDLDTLDVSRDRADKLLPRVPDRCIAVAESGYDDPAQVLALAGRCDGVLIGSSLVRDGRDPVEFLREVRR